MPEFDYDAALSELGAPDAFEVAVGPHGGWLLVSTSDRTPVNFGPAEAALRKEAAEANRRHAIVPFSGWATKYGAGLGYAKWLSYTDSM